MKRKSAAALNHYELLNLPYDADGKDVQQAYMNSMSIYSEDSLASYGALSRAEREWMLGRIAAAYEILMDPVRREEYDTAELNLTDEARKKTGKPAMPAVAAASGRPNLSLTIHDDTEGAGPMFKSGKISGENLKNIRVAKGATLEKIADITKIKKSYLEAIESGNVNNFPAPVFMKGFLKAYAMALGLNPAEISEKYMAD